MSSVEKYFSNHKVNEIIPWELITMRHKATFTPRTHPFVLNTQSNQHVYPRIHDDDGPSGASRARDEARIDEENYRAEINCQFAFRAKNGASQGA